MILVGFVENYAVKFQMENVFYFVLNFSFSIHPSLTASTKTMLVGAVVLPQCCTVSTVKKPANVQLASFISKNRLNRQNDNRIQAAQNARRPACSGLVVADVLFLSLLGRLSFVVYVAHLPA